VLPFCGRAPLCVVAVAVGCAGFLALLWALATHINPAFAQGGAEGGILPFFLLPRERRVKRSRISAGEGAIVRQLRHGWLLLFIGLPHDRGAHSWPSSNHLGCPSARADRWWAKQGKGTKRTKTKRNEGMPSTQKNSLFLFSLWAPLETSPMNPLEKGPLRGSNAAGLLTKESGQVVWEQAGQRSSSGLPSSAKSPSKSSSLDETLLEVCPSCANILPVVTPAGVGGGGQKEILNESDDEVEQLLAGSIPSPVPTAAVAEPSTSVSPSSSSSSLPSPSAPALSSGPSTPAAAPAAPSAVAKSSTAPVGARPASLKTYISLSSQVPPPTVCPVPREKLNRDILAISIHSSCFAVAAAGVPSTVGQRWQSFLPQVQGVHFANHRHAPVGDLSAGTLLLLLVT